MSRSLRCGVCLLSFSLARCDRCSGGCLFDSPPPLAPPVSIAPLGVTLLLRCLCPHHVLQFLLASLETLCPPPPRALQFLLASLETSGQYTDVEHFTDAQQNERFDVHLQLAKGSASGGGASVPSALTMWELEREDWAAGGVIAFGDSIRLRHVVTSRYLVVVRVRWHACVGGVCVCVCVRGCADACVRECVSRFLCISGARGIRSHVYHRRWSPRRRQRCLSVTPVGGLRCFCFSL